MKNLLILVFAAFLFACNNEQTTTEETTTNETTTTESAPEAEGQEVMDMIGQPADQAPAVTTTQPQAAATTSTPAAGVKLNPPHGEPGHRCEIAVGAPLPADGSAPAQQPAAAPNNIQVQPGNSPQPITAAPSGAPAPTSIMNSPAPTTSPAPATAGTTPPGMNPPHGQPGHDCAIPVGAPLKK